MTTSEAKELLRVFISAKTKYDIAKRNLEKLETEIMGLGVDYSTDRVQTTQQNDKLADSIDRLIRLRGEMIGALDIATRAMEKVVAIINKVEHPVLHAVLSRRYLHGETWELIAVSMNYDYRYVLKLHGKALAEVCRVCADK